MTGASGRSLGRQKMHLSDWVARGQEMASSLGIQVGSIALSLCVVAAQSAAAYEYPLGERSVREAYFLGRSTDGEKVAKFLGQYVRRFQLPVKGPYVAEIDFRTPYQQVVLRSWQNSIGYSAQQAQKDYSARPDVVVVRLFIYLTPTYPGFITRPSDSKGQSVERLEDFWREFRFRVAQEHSIEPKKLSGRPIYRRRGGLGGAEVLLEFDAAQFASRMTQVQVTMPEGQTVEAEFDLDKLK